MSENMLGYFPLILEYPENLTGDVARQVLQTLGLLIQNITETETLYCLFSNNHLNRILSMEFDFDEEILGYYVNVLKTISLKLDQHSAEFFLVEGATFTLYSKALEFGQCEDRMVLAAVRNITLSSYCIPSESVRECFSHQDTVSYFSVLSERLAKACCSLDALLVKESPDPMEIEELLCHIDDEFVYFNEVYSTGVPVVICNVVKLFWKEIILNLCLGSLSRGRQARPKKGRQCIRPITALIVLETYIRSVSNKELLSLLVSMMLGGDSLTLGNAIRKEHNSLDLSDILITDNPSEIHDRREVILGYLEKGDKVLAPAVLRLMANVLRHEHMTDDLLCTIGLVSFDRIARQKKMPILNQDSVKSFSVDSQGIFETATSACFSIRHDEVLEAIFSSISSPYTSPLTIMTVSWMLSKIIEDDMESSLERLRPYQPEVKKLLNSYNDCTFSKVIGLSDWVDIIPVLMMKYWPRLGVINTGLFSTRSLISSWKSTVFLQKLESGGFQNAHAKGLSVCLLCVMGYITRYQLYQRVSTGMIDKTCPFPGPTRVMKGDVRHGDIVNAPPGAFPINTNHALLKIWKSSDTECVWYDQIISIVVLKKDSVDRYRVASVVPIAGANPIKSKVGNVMCISGRVGLYSVLEEIKQSSLGLNFYAIDATHRFAGDEIKISFETSEDCEFVYKLVNQIVEDLRDRCASHIASLLPP